MSIRFAIRCTEAPASKEGNDIVRFSGTSEPFYRVSERTATKVGEDKERNPILRFVTGLDETKVPYYKWFTEAEKEEILKQLKELKPTIEDYYGGSETLDPSNKYFWGQRRDVSRVSLTNHDMDIFLNTKDPIHALAYLSFISGAFGELIAPTKEWAEQHQIPHYIALETDKFDEEVDTDVTKSEAHAALTELRKNADPEALFILAWCLQYDTSAYGAHLRSTSYKELVKYHINYIDGKLVTKKKRNMPKTFLEYAEKWKGKQTRPLLYAEAYIKAGEYFGFIKQKEKKYVTHAGTVLGNTIDEAIQEIVKTKNSQDLEALRDLVEAKWKE